MDVSASQQPHNAASGSTLVLTRVDIGALMTHADYMSAADAAFRAVGEGRANVPAPLYVAGEGGGFHGKGATIKTAGMHVAAVKLNANFPANPSNFRLPTIQGALLLFDAANGRLLALMDSIEVTLQRTAAATTLAARHLARTESAVATVCGCGDQARAQIAFLAQELPLVRVHAFDLDVAVAQAFATEISAQFDLDVRLARDLAEATSASDVIITCTTARAPFLRIGDVRPGTFIAAVGADSPDKSELFPELLGRAKIVVDSLEQCSVMGDLRHAIAGGLVSAEQVHATLGDLVVGRKPGRENDQEIAIFDSTGIAAQDAAAALEIYQRACAKTACISLCFGETAPAATQDRALIRQPAHTREQRS